MSTKKVKRIFSMLLSLSLVFSFVVFPVSAADSNESHVEDDPWMIAALSAEDCDIRYTADGFMIITATLSDAEIPAQTRTSTNPYTSSGTAYWNAPSEESFQCNDGWGTTCRIVINNDDLENKLEITYLCTTNDGPLTVEETVNIGDGSVFLVRSPDDSDLDWLIDITIKPARGRDGFSADWSLEANQY